MVELLIIADDFTGALDTGVQFAVGGAPTRVITDPQTEYSQIEAGVKVLVLDAETRHLPPAQAHDVVAGAVARAQTAGVPYIYKKTDSALRGNIGAELAAVCDAVDSGRVHFIPAFPQMGRTTKGGVHYVDGVPVGESVFGQDPFEPVSVSRVAQVVAQQTDVPVHEMGGEPPMQTRLPKGILVYDTETEAQMRRIARGLARRGELCFCAGCAGFASVLPSLLNLVGPPPQQPALAPRLLVACGSVNPITVAQLSCAEQAGVARVRLAPAQKLNEAWPDTPQAQENIAAWRALCQQNGVCILDSNDLPGHTDTMDYAKANGITLEQVRVSISRTMGAVVKRLLDGGLDATLMITGGDTLLGFMQHVGVSQLAPVCEVAPGAVLSGFSYQGKTYHVISKSGGFGKETLIQDLMQRIAASPSTPDQTKEDCLC